MMNFRKLRIYSVVVSSLITSGAYAGEQFAGQWLDVKATQEYWTPERMKSAVPLPMPIIAESPSQVRESLPPKLNGNPIGRDGKAPTVQVKPDLNPLFSRLHVAAARLGNRGTAAADFSSTALVPETADLSYPYSAVGRLTFVKDGVNYLCSASVIAPRILLTAGHCVYSNGTYNKSFQFTPAFRNGAAPYQTWGATFVIAAPSYISGTGDKGDYALLIIQDRVVNNKVQRIGDVVGYLGYQLQSLVPNHAHILGYPCNLDSCNKMHEVTAQSYRLVAGNKGEYPADLQFGASGGPWIQNFGIKSAGQADGSNPGFNRVLGVSSYMYGDQVLLLGSSNLSDEFTTIYNNVCGQSPTHCQ